MGHIYFFATPTAYDPVDLTASTQSSLLVYYSQELNFNSNLQIQRLSVLFYIMRQ